MDFKFFITVFAAIFIAELGDKTQLATMFFASNKEVCKMTVFLGSSLALILASALGVILGSALSQHINAKNMSILAGIGFILIGSWSLYKGLTAI
ncbi:MAG: TMEM165/GDT1 family protein [Desulfobulbaceae bacterium]|nr:TMEM165/GDT1 family protein [Desulfobulbaceae bacterium]MCK5544587.1 TMEM165/GDT1 family protein [Desulfobulbaceae bacterium]